MGGPGFWWDDWVILFVWVASIQMVVVLALKSRDDSPWDSWALTPEQRKRTLLWLYSSEPFYFIGTFGAKISMVLLYLRVLDGNPIFRRICWTTIALNAMGVVGFTIGSMISLWPYHYYKGDSAIPRDKLLGINFQISVFAISACNILFDIVVLLLPIGMLIKLRGISRRWKIWISVVFLTGFIATASSIVRMVYIFPLRNSTNITYDVGWFGLWCEIEVHLSTICCNSPPMAVLLKRRWIGNNHSRDGGESTRYVTAGTQGSGATGTTAMTQVSHMDSVFFMMTGERRGSDVYREEVEETDPSVAERQIVETSNNTKDGHEAIYARTL
ncbi:hypothetical protein Slin15195_G089450 [Septoria linicola]|uniref:Rhodopsin domain-containing protein n=1 Tax=Septoria linicola TaxID=215465 RepID=A0A9Q9B1N9_9PEZI|nr:hypothetical protein Slin15195_G089450 [Septoria linicola]